MARAFNENLAKILTFRRIAPSTFASQCEFFPSTILRIVDDRDRDVRRKTIDTIARTLNVDPEAIKSPNFDFQNPPPYPSSMKTDPPPYKAASAMKAMEKKRRQNCVPLVEIEDIVKYVTAINTGSDVSLTEWFSECAVWENCPSNIQNKGDIVAVKLLSDWLSPLLNPGDFLFCKLIYSKETYTKHDDVVLALAESQDGRNLGIRFIQMLDDDKNARAINPVYTPLGKFKVAWKYAKVIGRCGPM